MSLSSRLFADPQPAAPKPLATSAPPILAAASNYFIFAAPASSTAPPRSAARALTPEDIYHPTLYDHDNPSSYGFDLEFTPELSAADWQDFCADAPCSTCQGFETYITADGSKLCRQCHPIPQRVLSFHNHAQALRRRYARHPPIDPAAAERIAQRRAEQERAAAEHDAKQRRDDTDTDEGEDTADDDPDD